MITDKINNLFQYIEFLHSNIQKFKQYDERINELLLLRKERRQISPHKNYKDQFKYDEIQAIISDKSNLIEVNIIVPIINKATELNICDFQNEFSLSWNGVQNDIFELKNNFSDEDLSGIFKHKSQYIEYRTNTHEIFLLLRNFFEELDEVLKELFDYFQIMLPAESKQ